MTEYIIKIGFWVRAYDSFTVEADSDEQAIEKAKTAAKTANGVSGPSRTLRRRATRRGYRFYRSPRNGWPAR